MSKISSVIVGCPNCRSQQNVTVYESVTANLDPHILSNWRRSASASLTLVSLDLIPLKNEAIETYS